MKKIRTKPTLAGDIQLMLDMEKTKTRSQNLRAKILQEFDRRPKVPQLDDPVMTAVARAAYAYAELQALTERWKKIAWKRRDYAETIRCEAERLAVKAADRCGSYYSGSTEFVGVWGAMADAGTNTEVGDKYSKTCTWSRTDAEHIVTLDPKGVQLLVENEDLRRCSSVDGLNLIALYPDHSAVWVRPGKGKQIRAERGWIIGDADVCFHSTLSVEHAQEGYAKKRAVRQAEIDERKRTVKQQRRERLVAKLCHAATATLADAKALGYCEPGITAFQARFAIGDEATLPQLMQTRNPSAVALALSIARKIKHNK